MTQNNTISFCFEGDIKLTSVSLKKLGELLENIEGFFIPLIQKNFPELTRKDIIIALIKIESGSLHFEITSNYENELYQAFEDVYPLMQNKNWKKIPAKSLESMKNIIKFAGQFKCKTRIFPSNRKDEAVEFSEDISFIETSVKAISSVCGKVVKIGGKEKITTQIEIPGEGLVNIDVSEEMAKKLAHYLFEFVEIEGEITWNPEEEKITRIKAYDFKPFYPEKAHETIKKLSETFGKYFEHIKDPVVYIRELRGED